MPLNQPRSPEPQSSPAFSLTSPDLQHTEKVILNAISSLPQKKILLVLDDPALLLATNPKISPTDMHNLVFTLRLNSAMHSAIVTCAADVPLLQSTQSNAVATPMEIAHAAFVVGLAHQASAVVQLRMLDTGWAGDVSGVLRVSRGAGMGNEDREPNLEEKEVLYYVGGDGSVKVFERGGGGG